MRSSDRNSFIRDRTLKKNKIAWEGPTVDLKWHSWSIPGYEDQSVKHYRFHVVNDKAALAAGMTFDMLVGALDEEVPSEQPPDVPDRGANQIDKTYPQSPEDLHNDLGSARPSIMFIVEQSDEVFQDMISLIESYRGSSNSKVTGSSGRCSSVSQSSTIRKRKRTNHDDAEDRSRRDRGVFIRHR